MQKIKYIKVLLVEGEQSNFPDKAICPWCKENKVFEPHSFAGIMGGALLTDENDKESSGSSDRMSGFLDVFWHGAHKDEGGLGIHPDTEGHIMVANDVVGGQYSIYFCSPTCLRAFLNSCVDKLEQQIEQSKDKE
ncbi:MAG: hypothetical protein K8S27_11725 [Candidatus Omnitrophica bacterium]|nr:hypothetical protein [Candidatus Omnitrophota bacterium]